MTNEDKLTFIHVILRTEMYTRLAEENSIIGFVEGFSVAKRGDCNFTEQISTYLDKNCKIKSSSDGWSGQITRYAGRKSISWVMAFKQIGLEVLAKPENGGLTREMEDAIKAKVVHLIERIGNESLSLSKERWINAYVAVCAVKSAWFVSLWSEEESRCLKAIMRIVKTGQCFKNEKPYLPTKALLDLKDKFKVRPFIGLNYL